MFFCEDGDRGVLNLGKNQKKKIEKMKKEKRTLMVLDRKKKSKKKIRVGERTGMKKIIRNNNKKIIVFV